MQKTELQSAHQITTDPEDKNQFNHKSNRTIISDNALATFQNTISQEKHSEKAQSLESDKSSMDSKSKTGSHTEGDIQNYTNHMPQDQDYLQYTNPIRQTDIVCENQQLTVYKDIAHELSNNEQAYVIDYDWDQESCDLECGQTDSYLHQVQSYQNQNNASSAGQLPPKIPGHTTTSHSKSDVDDRAHSFIHLQPKDGGLLQNNSPTSPTSKAISITDGKNEHLLNQEFIAHELNEMNPSEIYDSDSEEFELDTSFMIQTDETTRHNKVTSPHTLESLQTIPTVYGGLKKLKSHATTNIKETYGHDFDLIREICEKDGNLDLIDYDPRSYEKYRRDFWPQWCIEGEEDLAYIYTQVRDSGLPNSMCQRVPLESKLNIDNWEHYLPEPEYKELLDGIKYGYTLG